MEIRQTLVIALTAFSAGWLVWQRVQQHKRKVARQRGPVGSVSVYGTDAKLNTIDLGAVSLSRGLELLEERLSYAGVFFENGEEAMAATQIAFQRDVDHFIDVNAVVENLTTVRTGIGVTERSQEETVELATFDEVRSLVAAYFNRPRDFNVYWKNLAERKPVL